MRKQPSAFDSLSLEFFKRGEELEAQFLREAREVLDESSWWEPPQLAEGSNAAHLPPPPTTRPRSHRALWFAGGVVVIGALGIALAATVGQSRSAAATSSASARRAAPATAAGPATPRAVAAPTAEIASAPSEAVTAPVVTAPAVVAQPLAVTAPAAAAQPTPAARPTTNVAAVASPAAPQIERKAQREQRKARKVVRNRERAVAHYRTGAAAFKRGDLRGASRAFRASVRADDRYAPAYRGLGLVHRRAKRAEPAVHAFRNYLRLAPRARDRRQVEAVIRSLQ